VAAGRRNSKGRLAYAVGSAPVCKYVSLPLSFIDVGTVLLPVGVCVPERERDTTKRKSEHTHM